MLKDKTILLGITGSIAAYKAANLTSMLIKAGAKVRVLMTQNATNFIHPTVFETLTGSKCLTDTFDRNFSFEVKHISLAESADLCLIAPASANVIGKIANGIADDMLSTTVMACRCKKLYSPAMNTAMYENPVVQDNMKKLEHYGWNCVEPAVGRLACGTVGKGKLAPEEQLFEAVLREIACKKDMRGQRVLVTAGATREPIDPVRFLTNHSTGKMGYALAKMAMLRGAEVTLVTGSASVTPPSYVKLVKVETAAQMYEAVIERAQEQDIIIKAAAVADYTPVSAAEEKIKKKDGETTLCLKRTKDILKALGDQKQPGQILCGFSMETEHMLENSRKKLETKHADLIVANNVKVEGAGFGTDTNVVTILTKDREWSLPCMDKEQVAMAVLDKILELSSQIC